MKNPKIKQVLNSLPQLSAEDLLVLELAVKSRKREIDSSIVLQKKAESISACPHCGSFEIKKIGIRNGKQRFKCNESLCGKTFTPLTGTSLARLRNLGKHIANAKCMIEGLTVRATAEKTTFIAIPPSVGGIDSLRRLKRYNPKP